MGVVNPCGGWGMTTLLQVLEKELLQKVVTVSGLLSPPPPIV